MASPQKKRMVGATRDKGIAGFCPVALVEMDKDVAIATLNVTTALDLLIKNYSKEKATDTRKYVVEDVKDYKVIPVFQPFDMLWVVTASAMLSTRSYERKIEELPFHERPTVRMQAEDMADIFACA